MTLVQQIQIFFELYKLFFSLRNSPAPAHYVGVGARWAFKG
jgi:hypothetical protein